MNALLMHNNINNSGGAERVAVSVLALLKNMGFKVTVLSSGHVAWERICRSFGYKLDEIKPEREIPLNTNHFDAYKRIAEGIYTILARQSYDIIISTYAETDRGLADISYIHYPYLYGLKEEREKFYNSSLWRLYYTPYHIIQRAIDNVFLPRTTLIVNSTYTQLLAQRYMGITPMVIHPPVDVARISKLATTKTKRRENVVITVGRIAPGKNLDMIPYIAAKTRSVKKFLIIGNIQEMFPDYLNHLQHLINKLGVRDKVMLLPNLTFEKKIELMSNARIYLHTMPNEHFGIAIVEGMAAGLIPVIHRSGGPWLDILQRRHAYGLSFTTIEQAAECIDEILTTEEWFMDSLSAEAQEAAKRFDEQIFKEKMRRLIQLHLNS